MTKSSRKLRRLILLPLCALLFFIEAVTVQAATYYVATTGTNASPGTMSQPFRTIARGVSSLQAGDTLYIRAGVYAEALNTRFLDFTFPNGTSWTNAVTIAAYPGESVTMRPSNTPGVVVFHQYASRYIIFDGISFDMINSTGNNSTVEINQGSNHIRFQNCEIKNSYVNGVLITWGNNNGLPSDYNEFINCTIHHSGRGGSSQPLGVNIPGPDTAPGLGRGHGFYISTSNNLVKNCTIHTNGEYGLKFYEDNGLGNGHGAHNNTIRDSRLYNNGLNTTRYGHTCCGGILLASGTGNRAINNLVYDNNDDYQHGIDTGYSATSALIYNNTIYNVGLGIQVTSTSTNAIIKNNIVYQTPYIPTQDRGVGTTWSNNLIGINPQFVDAAAGDFRLRSTSPAIDQGATLTEVKTDFARVTRPQGTAYDIGAYEEAPTGSDSTAPDTPKGLTLF